MKSLYALMLEKFARDIAVSTAVGMTAGIRAALSVDESSPIESRVATELEAVIGELSQRPHAVIDATPQLPPRRGPGRPRKDETQS